MREARLNPEDDSGFRYEWQIATELMRIDCGSLEKEVTDFPYVGLEQSTLGELLKRLNYYHLHLHSRIFQT